eukprot:13392068-Alexandrium_andersonii.AAC.1
MIGAAMAAMASWQLRAVALLPTGNPCTGLPSLPDTYDQPPALPRCTYTAGHLGPGKAHAHEDPENRFGHQSPT